VSRPRLVVADDHAMFADALRRVVEPECEVVATVGDGRALVATVAEHHPDLVVTDVSMPLLNGVEATRQMTRADSRLKVIVLTMHESPEFAIQAFEAGAAGYLLKHSAAEELVQAIREVLKGRHYVTPLIAKEYTRAMMERRGSSDHPSQALTNREREVLQLLAEGKTMKEAAAVLGVSAKTVEFHKYNIFKKLELGTSADLVRYAVRHGLVAD
jgi:DNA-binding NarL/FixJ family response regulator